MPRSPLVLAALEQRKALRAEFELVIEAAHERAAEACNDRLLNRDAMRRGVTTYSLFVGPVTRAHRWASEELLEYWRTNRRLTFEDYEQQYVDALYGVDETEGRIA